MRILRVCEFRTPCSSLSTDSDFVCIKVMYITAVPLTPQNLEYIQRQKDSFLNGAVPPDFPKGAGEAEFTGVGKESDILGEAGRKAMGLAY